MTDRFPRKRGAEAAGRHRWELLPEPGCIACGICADVCDYQALFMTREMARPQPAPGRCTGCGVCVNECPVDTIAIRLE